MSRKRGSATTIIGGSDGPTSIFLVGNKDGKLSLKQKFEKLFRKVYLYYGVTQKDIDEHTKRYEELVRVLAK